MQCIALAGNPNSGKTTLFNALTGLRYKVANYPGVTVERKKGKIRLSADLEATLVDLPGIYSLIGTSIDEKIATSVLLGEIPSEPVPDCVVVVVDSSNLERNLYLATQLIDCGLPLVIALNMIDLAEKRGITVHNQLLSRFLDVPVVSVVANKGIGLDALRGEIQRALATKNISSRRFAWSEAEKIFRDTALKLGNSYLNAEHKADSRSAIILGLAS